MEQEFYLLNEFNNFPEADAERLLGQITPNYADPLVDSIPPATLYIQKPPTRDEIVRNFRIKAIRSKTVTQGFEAEGCVGIKNEQVQNHRVELEGKNMIIRRFVDQTQFFQTLKSEPGVRKQLKSWTVRSLYSKPPVCMIVAVLLCSGSTLKTLRSEKNRYELEGYIPVGMIAAAATGVPLPTSLGNVGAKFAVKNDESVEMERDIGELTVIGLQLRVLRRTTWFTDIQMRRRGPDLTHSSHLASGDLAQDIDLSKVDVDTFEDAELEMAGNPWQPPQEEEDSDDESQ